eukprot:jgi/Undpi1/4689/HiC_scaffold_18.g08042.m1
MGVARAQAAEESLKREKNASLSQQRDLDAAKRRARHGPGHVPRPRRPPVEEAEVGGGSDGEGGSWRRGGSWGGRGGGEGGEGRERRGWGGARTGEGEVGDDGSATVWKVPRPPPLNVVDRSPAVVMNSYSMRARFQDRLVGRGRGPNIKAAKQDACQELLTNAALAWNEENPEDLIDMGTMVPLPPSASSRRVKDSMAEITDEFKAYVASWVEKVVLEEVHEACFPDDMDKGQRKCIHGMVDDLQNLKVLSKSVTINGRRRLSVMRKAMMEGLAIMSEGRVVVIDVPSCPTSPADVGDLGVVVGVEGASGVGGCGVSGAVTAGGGSALIYTTMTLCSRCRS